MQKIKSCLKIVSILFLFTGCMKQIPLTLTGYSTGSEPIQTVCRQVLAENGYLVLYQTDQIIETDWNVEKTMFCILRYKIAVSTGKASRIGDPVQVRINSQVQVLSEAHGWVDLKGKAGIVNMLMNPVKSGFERKGVVFE